MLRSLLGNKSQTTLRFGRKFSSTSSSSPSASASSYSSSSQYAIPISLLSLTVGFVAGRQSFRTPEEEERLKTLPKGYPLACCGDHVSAATTTTTTTTTDCDTPGLTVEQEKLIKTLKRIVGKTNLLDGREQNTTTAGYLKGARLGYGTALAIVRPTKLKHIQEIVQEAADANCAVLVQGSNTGLTGGSVPRIQSDGRPTVIISMKNFDTIFPIDDGEKVVCLAGAGLASLKHFVQDNFPDRESHSILGSTFLNPTTAAGKYSSNCYVWSVFQN
jgi:D-lactate dehydrogenase